MLDRTLPFGTISGVKAGPKYMQDGKFFDSTGAEIKKDVPEVQAKKPNYSTMKNDDLKGLLPDSEEWVDRKSAIVWLSKNG